MWSFLQVGTRSLVRVLVVCGALAIDVSFFYMNIFLLLPLSVCLYLCALTYASIGFIMLALFSVIVLPIAFSLSWVFFLVPLVIITMIGLLTRAILFVLWPLPYLLAALYAGIQYLLGVFYPTVLLLMPRLTIGSFFVILIVIKIASLIVSTHPRRGNRV